MSSSDEQETILQPEQVPSNVDEQDQTQFESAQPEQAQESSPSQNVESFSAESTLTPLQYGYSIYISVLLFLIFVGNTKLSIRSYLIKRKKKIKPS